MSGSKSRRDVMRKGHTANCEAEPGYVASGESEYSRLKAHAAPPIKLNRKHVSRIRGTCAPVESHIAQTQARIRWLECEAQIESDPARVRKLHEELLMRRQKLDRLKREARP